MWTYFVNGNACISRSSQIRRTTLANDFLGGKTVDEEMLKEELEEHFANLENVDLIANESFKPLYESLVRTLKEYFVEDGK